MISKFSGDYRWLSNFWACPVEYEGITYPSVEHAYQAAKLPNGDLRKLFAEDIPAAAVKKMGRLFDIDKTAWEARKVDVMRDLLKIKFAIPYLHEWLLATGDDELIEGNWWGDTFWGVCRGVGQNMLGRLLMEARCELKEAS